MKNLYKVHFFRALHNQKPSFSFGGAAAHHSLAEHHHEAVHLNTTQSWLNYQDKKAEPFTLFGFQDINDHSHADHTDPYAHLRQYPFFSLRRWYFSDPFFHEEDHEPLWNLPHGYLTYDDPLDNRNLLDRPGSEILAFSFLLGIFVLFLGYNALNFVPTPRLLMQDNITAEFLEEDIRRIRKENQALEKRRDELKARLAE